MKTDTLIVGGGLSGLRIAWSLAEAGADFHLVEARDRLGGRILTTQEAGADFDLGPAWFWPGQPRIDHLLTSLGLQRFDQFSSGDLMYEDERGIAQRGRGFASMEGSWRLAGGFGALIDAMSAKLPADRVTVSSRVTEISSAGDFVTATLQDGVRIHARKIVLALPPRQAAKITYSPDMPEGAKRWMSSVATWMAGQAKAVAIYNAPVWRNAGLSGDAMSRRGPMVEIHDASPQSGGPYALFGFIGVPPRLRGDESALADAIKAQLGRLFGSAAAQPERLIVKDWATDPDTAAEDDLQPVLHHPSYSVPINILGPWHAHIVLAGTETAPQFGGYLEGALEAAENALRHLQVAQV